MRLPWSLLALSTYYSSSFAILSATPNYDTHNYYVLEHDPRISSLDDVSHLLGVHIVEAVGELENTWLARTEIPERQLNSRTLGEDQVLQRYKQLRRAAGDSSVSRRSSTVSSVRHLSRQGPRQRVKRAPPPIRPPPETSAQNVAQRLGIEDPLFNQQWHLVNDEHPEHMMNPVPVWDMGITGKGVITSLVDDGLDYDHDDLKDNFDAVNSYDFNDHQDLPTPKLIDDHHGTRCAGQVAAGKNNACGLGIAYDAKVAGVRILSGPISDVDEAKALNYGYQNVSIYSCSWGPPDNGQAMEGPSYLIQKAVLNGINKGRDGKGSIFVFASGNGADHGDQCNFDGYTNSIYSVTISAIDYMGLHPYYSEPCAANMVVAYSSGSGKHIVTTDKGQGTCATSHGGTSAAAPNAAGVFTLAIEARPDLTWRDIQHLCVETARMVNEDDEDWETTATGRKYSYKYGYGALDAYLYVKAAQDWELVKPQAWIKTHTIQLENGTMTEEGEYSGGQFIGEGGVTSTITVTEEMVQQHNFEKLEHIDVKVWISHRRRGDVEVEIVSPNGIKSMLGGKRKKDSDRTGYPGWRFMTIKHWGENPIGDWTIRVFDQGNPENNGTFLGWNMMFWGSAKDAALATPYELPTEVITFPPTEDPDADLPPTTTKIYDKPTVPPQSSPTSTTSESASASSTPTVDEGWFNGLSNLVSHPKWFFGAIGAVAVFGLGALIFLWRRRRVARAARNADYSTISGGEDLQMSTVGSTSQRPRTTKELYDAFGEVSDDEDADEETHLRGGRPLSEGIGFHSGFLDDEEPESAGGSGLQQKYRDNPEDESRVDLTEKERKRSPERSASTSPSLSGDGSWQHASEA
ncbi:peptidase S8/S53 domain-containing protein [Armillaria novae-zelandiae]|uniref:Peptidase S8/S53 domain-containing protein n=1 Tax=Armillaria novae-zelandiae TaxID=153914 RepID=A0AA39ULR8_9AGAR|nr:peptidase S8/S53 domain-containing protein [Armillaria novae-zelandiae]